MVVEVNGIKYKQKQPPKRPQMSRTMLALTMMATMFDSDIGGAKQKERPRVDIVKEYGLIQQKKSQLSRSNRDWVEWQFEKNFERIQ